MFQLLYFLINFLSFRSDIYCIDKKKEKLKIKTKKVFLLTTILFLGSIPVGIAVARQRVGDAGLFAALSQKDNNQRLHDLGKFYRTIRIYEPYIITHTCYFFIANNNLHK